MSINSNTLLKAIQGATKTPAEPFRLATVVSASAEGVAIKFYGEDTPSSIKYKCVCSVSVGDVVVVEKVGHSWIVQGSVTATGSSGSGGGVRVSTVADATAGGRAVYVSGAVIKEMYTQTSSRILFTDETYTDDGYVDIIQKNGFCMVTVNFKQKKTVRLGGRGRTMCVGLPPTAVPVQFFTYNTYTEDPPIRCTIATNTAGVTTLNIVNVSAPSQHDDQFYRGSFTYPML